MRRMLALLALGWLAGCGTNFGGKDFVPPAPPVIYRTPTTQPDPAQPAAPRPPDAQTPPKPNEPTRITKAVDPPTIAKPTVGLSVAQLRLPAGTISRSEAFWKKIEERAIDIGTYDILQKNGIRVGLGAAAELETLLQPIDRSLLKPQSAMFIASNVKQVELPMKQAVPEQTIYDFDQKDVLTVRTYEEADDILVLEFQPAPRKAGDVRVSLLPLIRTLRKRLVPVTDTNTTEIEFRNPEKMFHLNLRIDLPLDSFLVIAPSPQAQAKMSLGHTFLMSEGETQQFETVLLISPQVMKMPTTQGRK